MLKSEKTTINGTQYEVTQLPYKQGHRLLLRLYKTVGPALADALSQAPASQKGKSLADVDVRDLAPALAAAVRGLAESLSESDFDFVVDTLAEYTKINTEGDKWPDLKGMMDFHFSGNYGELFQWLGFALRVNFAGFTGEQGLLANLLERVQAVAVASKSPSTSTGTSTE